MKKKVLVIGELNVDLIGTGLQTFPVLGREVMAQEMVLTLGSSSAILACGLARLGVPVTFISKVGRDDFGKYCLQALESKKIKTLNVIRDGKLRTGLTVSLNFRDDKAQVTYPGAIPHLYYKDISQKVFRQNDHLHISSFFLQDGLVSSFPQLFQDAKQMGMSTSMDPNCDNRNQWNSGIWKCLEFIDLLLLNEMEAINIAKAKSVNRALEIFAQKVPTVVIKLGSKGALAKSRGQVIQLPAFKIKPADSTGAGDSFDAGFLFSHLSGFDLRKSLTVANACGALSTQGLGGTATQADWDEIQRFVRKQAQSL
ncbi:MAG: carbohydrate kinase [Acidobacteria bacterium]|nr:MAG: carbohydrate kinase [Acidobacteriota bacterium]